MDVTLSFDNGPDPEVTPQVLDVLAGEGVAATFFVLGHKIAEPSGRALVERAAAAGHWIGNHTYTHQTPLGQLTEPGEAEGEIRRTEALIGPLAHPDRFFRPFGGGGHIGPHLLNAEALGVLEADAMTCVLWSSVPRDWEDPDGWPDRALAEIAGQDHALVVLHDLPTGAMRHLAAFIAAVRARGGRFRQDFPHGCTPLVRGHATRPMAPYLAA